MGIGDWASNVGDYLKSFGTTPQVQPINPNTAPGQPAAVPGTAAPSGVLMINGIPIPQQTLFDNPMLQGLLSAYFSGISTPRQAGLGGAIGRAGLSGLSGYEAARKEQLTPYITAATLGKTLTETEKAKAETGKTITETEQIKGYKAANNAASDYYSGLAADPSTPKELAGQYSQLASLLKDNPAKQDIAKIYRSPAEALKDVQQAAEAQAGIGLKKQQQETEKGKPALQQAQITEHEAQAARAREGINLDKAREEFLKGSGPLTTKDMNVIDALARQQADSQVGKPIKITPPGVGEIITGANAAQVAQEKDRQQRWNDAYNTNVASLIAQRQAGKGAAMGIAAGGGAPAAPASSGGSADEDAIVGRH